MESLNKLHMCVRKKKDHELRVVNILIALSDSKVSWRFFRETLDFLCIPELAMIVEERNSENRCGYVLCDHKTIVNPGKNICCDIISRKIYDISNRKKFCSDWCYGAHKYICDQISNEPLWKKSNPSHKLYTPYPVSEPGCPGEIHSEFSMILTDLQEKLNEENIIQPNKRFEKVNNVIKELDKLLINKKAILPEVSCENVENRENNEERKAIHHDEYLEDIVTTKITESEDKILQCIRKCADIIISWSTEQSRDFLTKSSYNKDDDHYTDVKLGKIEKDLTVPSHKLTNQRYIRERILLKKLQRIGLPVLVDFGVDQNRFFRKVRKYFCTCRFTSKNIIFDASETRWLIVLLIDMLLPVQERNNVNRISLLSRYGMTKFQVYTDILQKLVIAINTDRQNLVSSQGDIEN